jgi:hypothetical protein
MRFDRLSLGLLLALAASQVMPFLAASANAIAFAFLIRFTLTMRKEAFAKPPSHARRGPATDATHRLPEAA